LDQWTCPILKDAAALFQRKFADSAAKTTCVPTAVKLVTGELIALLELAINE